MSHDERQRSQRLSMLARLQDRREQEAVECLGRFRRHYDEQRQRLDSLQRYREEYRRDADSAARQGVSIGRLNRHRRFIQQLDVAIRQQHDCLQRLATEIERHEQAWRQAKGRQQGMQRLLDESRERLRHHEARQEQRLLDEIASTRHGPGHVV